MGNYKDTHGGNSLFSDWMTFATHPFNGQQAVLNKYQSQLDIQNSAATNQLFTQQTAAAAAATEAANAQAQQAGAAASAQTVFKYIAIGLAGVGLIVGAVFGIKYLKKRKAKA